MKQIRKQILEESKQGMKPSQHVLDMRIQTELQKQLKGSYKVFMQELKYRTAKPSEEEYETFKNELKRAVSTARAEHLHNFHRGRTWQDLNVEELRKADDPVNVRVVELLQAQFPRRYDALEKRHAAEYEYEF